MRTGIISLIADVFAGLAAFLLFFLVDAYFHVAADLRMGFVSVAVLYLAAGLLRGRPENAWLKELVVSSGGSPVALILCGISSSILKSPCSCWSQISWQFAECSSDAFGPRTLEFEPE